MSEKATPLPNGDGRDVTGRFVKGYRGGPGNPFGDKVEQLRTALLRCMTPEDFEKLGRKLLEKAQTGDIGAIKELLDRVFGKSAQSMQVTGSGNEGELILRIVPHVAPEAGDTPESSPDSQKAGGSGGA